MEYVNIVCKRILYIREIQVNVCECLKLCLKKYDMIKKIYK